MHQAVVEVGTDICRDINEAHQMFHTAQNHFPDRADQPLDRRFELIFQPLGSQLITDHARYNEIVKQCRKRPGAT